MIQFPKPYAPGQVWKVPLNYSVGDFWYLYISEIAVKHHVDNKLSLTFKVHKLPYNTSYGYLYNSDNTMHMDIAALESRLNGAEYVKTLRTSLTYEAFVDQHINSTHRLVLISAWAMCVLALTLTLIRILI